MLDKTDKRDEIKIDKKNRLLRVQFESDSTVENWKTALVKVKRLSEEMGYRRVLVDVRKQTDLPDTLTLFDFGAGLPNSIAFAVLCELHLEDHRFIENVAINRGLAVKDFDSEQNAVEWLKKWPNIDSGKK
jgi:hypothetical protein